MDRKKTFRLLQTLILGISLPLTVFLVFKKTSFLNKAYHTLTGTKANFVVNLTDAYPYNPPWGYYSQGGEESTGMLKSVIEPVKSVKPYYIRIDHIYDFYNPVSRDTGGKLIYDWTKLDAEIRAIVSSGAKPFISLSYMPSVISSGSETDLPTSWNEWGAVVQATVEHISGKTGLNIANVYYEVWNEPDLFGGFKLTGAKNYLTLYKYAHDGAMGAQNTQPFKLGGPATTALYKNWFTGFFSYAESNNLRVDFYSWHRYSKFLNDYEDDVTTVKEWLVEFPSRSSVEFIITEAGPNSETDPVYDNNFAAIHTIAMYATVFQKVPKIFAFELKDGPGPSQYWGRWGMFTHEKYGTPVAKPRFAAMEFLNRMKGTFYPIYGQGSWVKAFTTTDGSVIRTLVVNYDPYSSHLENVPLTFVNLPKNSFTFRRTDFLGPTTSSRVNLGENKWSTQVLMGPNTASIFEIVPN